MGARGTGAAYLLLLLAPLFWSGNWVVGRAVSAEIPPIGLNFWRWLVAALILLPFVWRRLPRFLPVIRRRWRLVVVLGLVGMAAFNTMVYRGLAETTVVNSVILNASIPAIILVWGRLIDGEPITLRRLAGLAVAVLGVLVIVTEGRLERLAALTLNPGDLWIVAAMPLWALYSVLVRRRPAELDGPVFLFALAVASLVFLAPGYLVEHLAGERVPVDWRTVATVAYVALFASVVAFQAWNMAVARLGPAVTGFSLYLMPAFGTVLAVFFLGEIFAVHHAAGIALIVAGVTLSSTRRRVTAPAGDG